MTETLRRNDAGRTEDTPERRGPIHRLFDSLPGLVLLAFLIALLIKSFLFQAFVIPSGSMKPTLVPGDRVLVNRVVLHIRDVHQLDVVVIRNPSAQIDRGAVEAFLHWLGEGLGFAQNDREFLIKRVIGLPGDTLEARDGNVFVNGRRIGEPYLTEPTADFALLTVPKGKLFLMGDNRDGSDDSRGALGPVPAESVVGVAFARVWPPSRIDGVG